MKTLIFVLSVYLSSSAALFASDAATLHFLGFSGDGKYLAFEQFGIADGVGEAYAELHLIDVEKNAYAVPVFAQYPDGETARSEQAENEEQAIDFARQVNLQAARADMEKLKLQETSKGQQVIAHPLSDLSADPFEVRFTPHLPLAGHAYDEFILDLQETELKQDCYALGNAKIFNLKIRRADQTAAQATILQADKRLPKSRTCPLGYRIAYVYVYREKYLAVFLHMLLPGFEGHDMRYLVVTGVLPENSTKGEPISDDAWQKREAVFQQAIDAVEQKKADTSADSTDDAPATTNSLERKEVTND